jgi:hypothetical protein
MPDELTIKVNGRAWPVAADTDTSLPFHSALPVRIRYLRPAAKALQVTDRAHNTCTPKHFCYMKCCRNSSFFYASNLANQLLGERNSPL